MFGRRFAAAKISRRQTALGQVTASSFVLVPLALMIDTPWRFALPSNAAILAIIGLALIILGLLSLQGRVFPLSRLNKRIDPHSRPRY